MKLFVLAVSEDHAEGAAKNRLMYGIQHPFPNHGFSCTSLEHAITDWEWHPTLTGLYLAFPHTRICYTFEITRIADVSEMRELQADLAGNQFE